MKKRYLILPLLCMLPLMQRSAVSWGQAASPDSSYYRQPRYGVFGTVNLINHQANFQSLPGVPSCCPKFTSGDGTGYTVGLAYEHPLQGEWLLGGRLAFEHAPARFSSREATTFIVDGKATPGAFDHELEASYDAIWAHHTIGYRALDNIADRLDLVGYVGLGIGLVTGSSFSQRERIVEPAGVGEFTDTRSPIRNEASGEIPGANSIAADVRLGISSHVVLNRTRTLLLAPEIWYSIGLTDAVPALSWGMHELRLGAVFQYIPQEDPPPAPTPTPESGGDGSIGR